MYTNRRLRTNVVRQTIRRDSAVELWIEPV